MVRFPCRNGEGRRSRGAASGARATSSRLVCRRRRRHPKQRTSYFPIGRGWSKTGRAWERAQLHHAQNMGSYLEVPALVRQRDLVEKLPQLAATGSSPRALPPRRRAGSQGSEFRARAELLPPSTARQFPLPPRSTDDVVMLHVVESRVVRTGGVRGGGGGDRSCGGGGGICGWGGRVGGGGGGGGGRAARSRSGSGNWGRCALPGSHEPLLEVALARNAASRVAHRVDAGRFLGQSGVRMKRPREHLVADDDPAVRVVVPGLAAQRVPDELSRAEIAEAVPLQWPGVLGCRCGARRREDDAPRRAPPRRVSPVRRPARMVGQPAAEVVDHQRCTVRRTRTDADATSHDVVARHGELLRLASHDALRLELPDPLRCVVRERARERRVQAPDERVGLVRVAEEPTRRRRLGSRALPPQPSSDVVRVRVALEVLQEVPDAHARPPPAAWLPPRGGAIGAARHETPDK